MFQFSCRFAFLSAFRLSNRPSKITPILTLSTRQHWRGEIVLKHAPKLIIFGIHNLQTFKHNTLIIKLLLMQFYLINICPKLHHRHWRKLRVTLPVADCRRAVRYVRQGSARHRRPSSANTHGPQPRPSAVTVVWRRVPWNPSRLSATRETLPSVQERRRPLQVRCSFAT